MINWSRALGMSRVALQEHTSAASVLERLAERIDA
jgi:hypothetical protein